MNQELRTRLFICYSHKDKRWQQRLRICLKPLEEEKRFVVDDTEIKPGTDWEKYIRKGLERAKAAILLLSHDFLASDFISKTELPALLGAARNEGATILPVYVRKLTKEQLREIHRFQGVNSPERALTKLKEAERDEVFNNVYTAVNEIFSDGSEEQRTEELGQGPSGPEEHEIKPGSGGSHDTLHVIGWRGVESDQLYENFHPVACLVTERSFDSLPRIYYQTLEFDVVVADVELFPRYVYLERLENLRYEETISTALSDVAPFIDNLTSRLLRPEGKNRTWGIPIQFGFNEILVNLKGINPGPFRDRCAAARPGEMSYEDFDICEILSKDDVKAVAFYDWYIPTICHLLLADQATPIQEKVANIQCVKDWKGVPGDSSKSSDLKYVRTIQQRISDLLNEDRNRNRILPLDTLQDVKDYLNRDRVGIIYGGSSALLATATDARAKEIKVVIPREGVLVWVNTGAVLINARDRKKSVALLAHWLKEEQQKQLCAYEGYRACPANGALLKMTLEDRDHPARETLQYVLGDETKAALRGFPEQIWRDWADAWEKIIDCIRKSLD